MYHIDLFTFTKLKLLSFYLIYVNVLALYIVYYSYYVFVQRIPGSKFSMIVTATDLGETPQSDSTYFDIQVVESHKKAPAFLPRSSEPIKIKENFTNFDASIVRLQAISNIDNSSNWNNTPSSNLLFELVTGTTEQSNKGNTFRYYTNCAYYFFILILIL